MMFNSKILFVQYILIVLIIVHLSLSISNFESKQDALTRKTSTKPSIKPKPSVKPKPGLKKNPKITTKKTTNKPLTKPKPIANNYLITIIKMIKEINKYRKLHQVESLVVNDTLSKKVEEIIEPCEINTTEKFFDLKNMEISLGAIDKKEKSANIVRLWYDTKHFYDFNDKTLTRENIFFAGLVYKNAKQIGCGATEGKTHICVICLISTSKDIRNDYKDNIFKRKE
uniref:SCP domain-containing protein n=1 Tax=Parastrongyloides trichosuri TaxID=131310 RepID=A0A0N4ZGW1_PARTI